MTSPRTPARLARVGVALSVLLSGFAIALLVAAPVADPTSVLLAATAAVLAVSLAAGRMGAVAPARTVTVGHRAREHAAPLHETPAPAHPDTAGRVRSRAPGRPVPAA